MKPSKQDFFEWSRGIFILLSIKTRIETNTEVSEGYKQNIFLSYYPLKQGLKQVETDDDNVFGAHFYPTIH